MEASRFTRAGPVALLGVALAMTSCTDGAETNPSAVPRAQLPETPASRVERLRERFQIQPPLNPDEAQGHLPKHPRQAHPALARGVGASFGAPVAGRVVVAVPTAAKKAVRRSATVVLPATADGSVKLTDDASHVSLSFSMRGATAARLAATRDGVALYAGASAEGGDVVHRVHAEGTEDFVVFETKPAKEELDYEVDVSGVPGLRLVGNVLEFVATNGTPVLRVAPPYVVGEDGSVREATLSVEGCAYDTDPAGPWGRAVTPAGAPKCGVRVVWSGGTYPAMVDPAWVATGSMTTARAYHRATLLHSGQVLLAGGSGGGTYLSSAELFDGVSTFAATGSMTTARELFTATLLPSGKVLITGGYNGSYLSRAELFDGVSTFTATGSMTKTREYHTATLLNSGKVLIAGGYNGTILAAAELFDGTSTFAATGSMRSARTSHTATLLNSGQVLLAGGANLSSAELFDGTSAFWGTGSMTAVREDHTATLLNTGQVLITGGENSAYLSSAEAFDGTSRFSAVGSMTTPRMYHSATLLISSGKVVIAGGQNTSTLSSAELFVGGSSFTPTGPLTTAREVHTATLLNTGKVLIAGGLGLSGSLSSAELFAAVAAGGTCSVAGDCLSGVCTGGVCCSGACNASTSTCNASGMCLLNTSQPSTDPTECASGFASDGYCCNTSCGNACDVCSLSLGASANGSCTTAPAAYPGSPACGGGFACDGTDVTCPATPCTSDVDCLPTDYCGSSGLCTPQLAPGASCAPAADCVGSGSCRECPGGGGCVDGVCCSTTSCSGCEACALPLQAPGGTNGVCSASLAGSDPHDDCPQDPGYPASCLADGNCNGQGACRTYAPNTVTCGGTSCTGDTATGLLCNGAGACEMTPGTNCSPYTCAGGKCNSTCATDGDCADATFYCTAAHTCASKQGGGVACSSQDQCTTGLCVDGFCCNQACGGECQACDVQGALGICSAVTGAPHGARSACTGTTGGTCAGACDGKNTAACAYPTAGTSCGSTCSNSTLTSGACDGAGTCGSSSATCPNNLVCSSDGTSCASTCSTDSDCAQGFVCTGGVCAVPLPPPSSTCTDDYTSKSSGDAGDAGDGGLTDCAPYLCDVGTGTCFETCTADSDCVSPNVCNASGACARPVPPAAPTATSTATATAPTSTAPTSKSPTAKPPATTPPSTKKPATKSPATKPSATGSAATEPATASEPIVSLKSSSACAVASGASSDAGAWGLLGVVLLGVSRRKRAR